MSLEVKINTAIKEAMKAKDQVALRGLRAIKSAILIAKTETGASDSISEEKEIQMLSKMAKQRNDSMTIFQEQNRDDLALKEQEELDIIQSFLPRQMDAADLKGYLENLIQTMGVSDMRGMGQIMGKAAKELAGKADGKTISNIVKEILSP